MGYYIDIESITLDSYKNILKDAYMIPSRAMLKEDIDKNIDKFKSDGIENVAQLQRYLKNKLKLKVISEKLDMDEKYLNALRLELNAYLEKPTKIKDFTCLSDGIKQKLEEIGIKNTFDLYNCVYTQNDRNNLAQEAGISSDDVLMIAKLADLSRVRWVNHTFAYVLYVAGYDTVTKIAKADYEKMYTDVKDVNTQKQIFKGNIGLNDMKLLVILANGMPTDDIKY